MSHSEAPFLGVVSATLTCALLLSLSAVVITARSKRRAREGAPPINTLELRGVSCVVTPRFFSWRGGAPQTILDNLSVTVRRGQLVAMRACSLSRLVLF